jgi:hypothetical protein
MPELLIDRQMTLPAILSRYPSCRKVFDRYGLLGCGGPLRPEEKLEFFARAHRVNETQLIAELEQAAREAAASSPTYNPGPADTIYRRFFKAGIATMFTFGCVLGGINLAIMAARHELASLDNASHYLGARSRAGSRLGGRSLSWDSPTRQFLVSSSPHSGGRGWPSGRCR